MIKLKETILGDVQCIKKEEYQMRDKNKTLKTR